MRSGKDRRSWTYLVTNLLYVLSTAFVGMLAGAVVMYFSASFIYLAVRSAESTPGAHCGEGMAIGMLSILGGGFLGTVVGTALAVNRPILSKLPPKEV